MTNKTKNILVVIGFLIVLIISYKLSITQTLNYKKQYSELKQDEVLFSNMPKQLSVLKQKQKHFDSLLIDYQLSGSSIQNNLLKTINSFADSNNIKVVSFLEPHTISSNDLLVKTYDLTLEGNYNDIINLIYQLEQKTKFGEIINLNFEKKKNFRSNSFYLQARVLLRSFG